jgi:tRNA (guanine37-N1)-methyltransferase
MVLKPEPVVECVEWLERRHGRFRKLVLCPSGRPFRQADADALAAEERVLLLCGRYEGFDERIHAVLDLEPVSVGDFVLAGGELPALAVCEAAVRLVPGVLGDERSAVEESFRPGAGLDHPHYTRPEVFRGHPVPGVLLGGDHAAIRRWRADAARERTRRLRPGLEAPAAEGSPPGGRADGEERQERGPAPSTERPHRDDAVRVPTTRPPTEM